MNMFPDEKSWYSVSRLDLSRCINSVRLHLSQLFCYLSTNHQRRRSYMCEKEAHTRRRTGSSYWPTLAAICVRSVAKNKVPKLPTFVQTHVRTRCSLEMGIVVTQRRDPTDLSRGHANPTGVCWAHGVFVQLSRPEASKADARGARPDSQTRTPKKTFFEPKTKMPGEPLLSRFASPEINIITPGGPPFRRANSSSRHLSLSVFQGSSWILLGSDSNREVDGVGRAAVGRVHRP